MERTEDVSGPRAAVPTLTKWLIRAAKEFGVRLTLACVAIFAGLAACDAPGGGEHEPSARIPVTDPNTFRADIDPERAYAGEWAAASNHCSDDKRVWTIERTRMAIQPDMRFCVFDPSEMYVSEGHGPAPTTWSAGPKGLWEGKESHDFLFFRDDDNLREMRVTFNDARSVELVRCPMRS